VTGTRRGAGSEPGADLGSGAEVPAAAEVAAGARPGLAGFHAIVPAGGAGTRLWPLSRAAQPKFLLDLTGAGRSLLQQTWDRLVMLTAPGGVVVVTGTAHAAAVAGQLPGLGKGNLIAEPSPRDSAAAIGLAAAVLERRDPGCVVGSFAADHVVRDVPALHAAVTQAVAVARTGDVVTLGIEPTFASTAFGYIRCGDRLSVAGAPSALRADAFVEKPDAPTAAGYLSSGRYRWNAGIFVAQAAVVLELLARSRPGLHAGLEEIAEAYDTPRRDNVLGRVWPHLEKVAFDYAVAEPAADAGRVAVVPADPGWDDVGDFAALAGILGGGGLQVLGDAGQVLDVGAAGLAVPGSGRLVAVLGLDDVVVVDTADAVLVTTRARAQGVKALVEELRARGRADLL